MPTSRTRPQTVSRKALAGLTLIVLLLHLLLQDDSPTLAPNTPAPVPAFSTRALEPVDARADAPTARQPGVKRPAPSPRKADESPATAGTEPSATNAGATPIATTAPATEVAAPTMVAQAPRETASPERAYRVPGAALLQYDVKGSKFPYNLRAELLWQPDGTHYDARLTFSAGPLPVMRQRGFRTRNAARSRPTSCASRARSPSAPTPRTRHCSTARRTA